MGAPSLLVLEARLDGALSNLVQWKVMEGQRELTEPQAHLNQIIIHEMVVGISLILCQKCIKSFRDNKYTTKPVLKGSAGLSPGEHLK